jgi:phage terminase large subunit-like protein
MHYKNGREAKNGDKVVLGRCGVDRSAAVRRDRTGVREQRSFRSDPGLQVDPAAVQAVPRGAEAGARRDFPFRFDVEKAERVCRFIERLPHTKGKWARSKETIRLEPWQVWELCCVFGWLRKANGLRRFRVFFEVVPRKNGKSAKCAGIGLYMLCADGECGAEVYSGATNEKQAWEVFGPAQLMALRTPALLQQIRH